MDRVVRDGWSEAGRSESRRLETEPSRGVLSDQEAVREGTMKRWGEERHLTVTAVPAGQISRMPMNLLIMTVNYNHLRMTTYSENYQPNDSHYLDTIGILVFSRDFV